MTINRQLPALPIVVPIGITKRDTDDVTSSLFSHAYIISGIAMTAEAGAKAVIHGRIADMTNKYGDFFMMIMYKTGSNTTC